MSVTHGPGPPLAHAAMDLSLTFRRPAVYLASRLCRSGAIWIILPQPAQEPDLAHV